MTVAHQLHDCCQVPLSAASLLASPALLTAARKTWIAC